MLKGSFVCGLAASASDSPALPENIEKIIQDSHAYLPCGFEHIPNATYANHKLDIYAGGTNETTAAICCSNIECKAYQIAGGNVDPEYKNSIVSEDEWVESEGGSEGLYLRAISFLGEQDENSKWSIHPIDSNPPCVQWYARSVFDKDFLTELKLVDRFRNRAAFLICPPKEKMMSKLKFPVFGPHIDDTKNNSTTNSDSTPTTSGTKEEEDFGFPDVVLPLRAGHAVLFADMVDSKKDAEEAVLESWPWHELPHSTFCREGSDCDAHQGSSPIMADVPFLMTAIRSVPKQQRVKLLENAPKSLFQQDMLLVVVLDSRESEKMVGVDMTPAASAGLCHSESAGNFEELWERKHWQATKESCFHTCIQDETCTAVSIQEFDRCTGYSAKGSISVQVPHSEGRDFRNEPDHFWARCFLKSSADVAFDIQPENGMDVY